MIPEQVNLAFSVCLSRWASWGSSDARRFRRFIVQLTIAKLHCTIFLLEGLSAVVVKADHEPGTCLHTVSSWKRSLRLFFPP